MSKIKHFEKILLITIALAALPLQCFPTPVFNSQAIMRLFEKLPETVRNKLSVHEHRISETVIIDASMICDNTNIIARYNDHSELIHLGLHIINESSENNYSLRIKNYIERLLLTCCLIDNTDAILFHLQNENAQIIINEKPLADFIIHNAFCSVISFDTNTPVSIEKSPDGFIVTFSPDHFNHISIKTSGDIFTITGMDKYELENALVRDMLNLPKGQTVHVNNSSTSLYRHNNRVSMRHGLVYYGIAGISSNQFFYRNRTSVPVFDRTYLYESVSNLFLNIIESTINLQITHRLYGNRQANYLVNINDFLSNFGESYTIYFGWQNRESDNLTASVFIYNNIFNYSHMLIVGFNSEDIFKDHATIQATFYTYTPHGNIRTNL